MRAVARLWRRLIALFRLRRGTPWVVTRAHLELIDKARRAGIFKRDD